ncbi:hypothetical protein BAUCODRAFT_39361 [Baudoinia panamericana UAMH 10762]|uniref:Presequence protease, mitochondrial n=1 Tax=Baudoinia panamericana (strain UAMH 10762) TaxID=717646 RepID=M2MIW0_BAUPA|nr:uncharacterized protein BAUCODRAFT_39361 [Baudoinia panamericana UAMH 10762]EMC91208.1 hypothetical protein BAUCODRAFT_39361 [Baudoinia panamericana UAMH 10762]
MLTSRCDGRVYRAVAPYVRRLRASNRHYASVADLSSLPRQGDHLHGFTLQRTKHVPELELSALHFRHDKTGADYLHIAREDKNNVFAIGFKTNPPDATGVPHILEHVTLCGSEKYPVRDPFFKMLPRSLQNFMNAMTSADHTTYPFATTNPQDFRNLMSVYLDATLHPLLKRSDFVQEGWRIGPADPRASDAQHPDDLIFKGVVYNEMKGQVSDSTYLFYIQFMEHIIPALNNSGGDPSKMTDLTYEQLNRFHKAHYHPSNSKIVTYGNQDLEQHLQYIGQKLDGFDKINIDTDIKDAVTLDKPVEVVVKGPIDPLVPPEAQYKSSISWLTGSPADVYESFALQVVSSLLLNGYGAPLYRALIESGLGTDFSPNTGYDSSTGRRGIFTIGLTGVSEDNVPNMKELIYATLNEQADQGFEKQKVDGILHALELSLKHKTANFGLGIAQALTGSWFNGVDPFASMDYGSIINRFREDCEEGPYLEGLIKKYLLTDHTLTFTMAPSSSFGAEIVAEEAARLKSKIEETVKQFSSKEEAHQHLRDRELELLEEQDKGKTENVDLLPTLHVTDIERQQSWFEVRDSAPDEWTKVQWRETATNGLTYFRARTLFENLPDELRMLVPLFCDSLMRIGTKDKSMEQLEDVIKLKTGGISFGYKSGTSPYDNLQASEGFSLSGYAFDHNVPAMYELFQTILVETDFDAPKAHGMIKELLRAGADGAVDGIASSGHGYAARYARSGLSLSSKWSEQIAGLTQVKLITSLASAEDNQDAMNSLIGKLKTIQAIAVTSMKTDLRVALTCGSEASSANETALQRFLDRTRARHFDTPLPDLATSRMAQAYPSLGQRTFFPFPTYQVSYTGLALPTGPYTSPATAPFAILATLLTHKHLHHEIREKGGAYGAGASTNGTAGYFGMYSYRDPNPVNSLQIMQHAGRWAAEREWSDRELEEAKLSVFQSEDAPVSVNQEGMTRFVHGIDHEMEQRRREWLLDVDAGQVREAAGKLNEALEGLGGVNVAVLGAKRDVVEVGEGWTTRDMGLAVKQGGEEEEQEGA